MFSHPGQFPNANETRMGGFDEKGQKVSDVVKQVLITICILCFLAGFGGSCFAYFVGNLKKNYIAEGIKSAHTVVKMYREPDSYHVVVYMKGQPLDVVTDKNCYATIKVGETITVLDAEGSRPFLLIDLQQEQKNFWLNKYLSGTLLIISLLIGLFLFKITYKK